jgi:hypothetical protein
MELTDLKDRYRIPQAWRDLGLRGEPAKSCTSPLREDRTPSFSVFDDGRRFHDFATGDRGDVLDLIAKVRGCDTAAAIKFVEERLGIVRQERKPQPTQKAGPKLPSLRRGTDAELRELSERRGFSMEGLRLAERRGFLHFCAQWGHTAWCITDCRRELHEFRRVGGEKWPAYGRLPARKCHCVGTGKSWPIGTLESERCAKVAWVEGAPDFLAALHFILLENKTDSVAPVGILGASNHRLAPEALAKFKGKRVCLFPHVDDAGRKAMREWARQLKEAGAARVTAFDLSGLVLADGSEGKDLADVLRIHPDCFESAEGRKFWEVMP